MLRCHLDQLPQRMSYLEPAMECVINCMNVHVLCASLLCVMLTLSDPCMIWASNIAFKPVNVKTYYLNEDKIASPGEKYIIQLKTHQVKWLQPEICPCHKGISENAYRIRTLMVCKNLVYTFNTKLSKPFQCHSHNGINQIFIWHLTMCINL